MLAIVIVDCDEPDRIENMMTITIVGGGVVVVVIMMASGNSPVGGTRVCWGTFSFVDFDGFPLAWRFTHTMTVLRRDL